MRLPRHPRADLRRRGTDRPRPVTAVLHRRPGRGSRPGRRPGRFSPLTTHPATSRPHGRPTSPPPPPPPPGHAPAAWLHPPAARVTPRRLGRSTPREAKRSHTSPRKRADRTLRPPPRGHLTLVLLPPPLRAYV